MRTIRVDRDKWLRLSSDSENDGSCLWNGTKACCLGHVIHQTTKYSWEELSSKGTPADHFKKQDKFGLTALDEYITFDGESTRLIDSEFSKNAIDINDDPHTTDAQKEKALKALFSKNKLKLVFFN